MSEPEKSFKFLRKSARLLMKVNVVHFSNLSPHQQPAVSLKIYNPIKSWLQFDSSIPKSHLCFSLSSLLKNDYGRGAVDQIKSGLSFEPRVEDKTLKFDICCYSATTESDKNPENPLPKIGWEKGKHQHWLYSNQ